MLMIILVLILPQEYLPEKLKDAKILSAGGVRL